MPVDAMNWNWEESGRKKTEKTEVKFPCEGESYLRGWNLYGKSAFCTDSNHSVPPCLITKKTVRSIKQTLWRKTSKSEMQSTWEKFQGADLHSHGGIFRHSGDVRLVSHELPSTRAEELSSGYVPLPVSSLSNLSRFISWKIVNMLSLFFALQKAGVCGCRRVCEWGGCRCILQSELSSLCPVLQSGTWHHSQDRWRPLQTEVPSWKVPLLLK